MHRTAVSLGLNVYQSTAFPASVTVDDVYSSLLEEAKGWADDLAEYELAGRPDMMRFLYEELYMTSNPISEAEEEGLERVPVGFDYVVAAERPAPGEGATRSVGMPRAFVAKKVTKRLRDAEERLRKAMEEDSSDD